MRNLRGVDPLTYVRAIPLLIKNPELMAVPLLSGIIGVAFARFFSSDALGLGQLVQFLLDAFALSVSIILADTAWRRGRGSFEDAWSDARRKAGDILLTAIGLNFVIFVANFAGALLSAYLSVGLTAVAVLFLVYALPAAAIGGVPGGAALQVSIERVREAPLPAIVLTVVFLVLYYATLLAPGFLAFYFGIYGTAVFLAAAVLKAIVLGYMALVLAKTYTDSAFGRFRL
jgi:hypothetical protein